MCGLSSLSGRTETGGAPDNTRTGVTKACRYDPDLNPTYQEMATHYGVGVVPARPYKLWRAIARAGPAIGRDFSPRVYRAGVCLDKRSTRKRDPCCSEATAGWRPAKKAS